MQVPIPCPCPGTPHAGDTVTLRETLDFLQATTARKALSLRREEASEAGEDGLTPEEVLAVLTEQYVLLGVESWSLVDDSGKPIQVGRTSIRRHLLSHDEAAALVADKADGLYSAKVLLPLLNRASNSSDGTSTTPSTSLTTDSGPQSPTPSSPSSTSTTPMDDTEPTSPSLDGVSSSLPSLASAV